MNVLNNFVRSFYRKENDINPQGKESFSQCGEDLIIAFIFEQLKIQKPSFLDIGAHHPHYLSNSFYFYKKGCRGVNVEPDPLLLNDFIKHRGEDINLNIGIGIREVDEVADFYVLSAKTLNTFSKEDAEKYESYGTYKIEKIIKMPLISVNKIIKENFKNTYPNLISIDVEGLDFEIVKSFDFNNYRPEVICIETLTYTEDKSEEKLNNIIEYVCSKDYFVYADTYINTIFVNNKSWLSRK